MTSFKPGQVREKVSVRIFCFWIFVKIFCYLGATSDHLIFKQQLKSVRGVSRKRHRPLKKSSCPSSATSPTNTSLPDLSTVQLHPTFENTIKFVLTLEALRKQSPNANTRQTLLERLSGQCQEAEPSTLTYIHFMRKNYVRVINRCFPNIEHTQSSLLTLTTHVLLVWAQILVLCKEAERKEWWNGASGRWWFIENSRKTRWEARK